MLFFHQTLIYDFFPHSTNPFWSRFIRKKQIHILDRADSPSVVENMTVIYLNVAKKQVEPVEKFKFVQVVTLCAKKRFPVEIQIMLPMEFQICCTITAH